jgi:hypothetical protein
MREVRPIQRRIQHEQNTTNQRLAAIQVRQLQRQKRTMLQVRRKKSMELQHNRKKMGMALLMVNTITRCEKCSKKLIEQKYQAIGYCRACLIEMKIARETKHNKGV